MLDRDSDIPLFKQIKEKLEKEIQKMPANTKIDSEPNLADKYGVSRGTVKKAIDILNTERKVYRIPKKGTYVAENKIQRHFDKLPSYSEEIKERGLKPGAYSVEFAKEIADEKVQKILNLEKDDIVWKIKRIRTADDVPIILTTSYLPIKIFPEFTEEEVLDSLYKAMDEKYDNRPYRAHESYSAVNSDHVIASLLNIDKNDALIYSERLSFSKDNRPVEYSTSYIRGDKYEIHVDVSPSGSKSKNKKFLQGRGD